MIEIDEGIGRPQPRTQLFACDQIAGALQQYGQYPERMFLEVDAGALFV
jgi:hypothetical protein